MNVAKKLLSFVLAFLLVGATFPGSMVVAQAAETSMEDLQAEVERTAQAYDKANQKVNELADKMAENEAKIAELEEQLPNQKASTSTAIANHYKLQQETPSLITLILSANDLEEFISTLSYLDVISDKSVNELQDLQELQEELEERRATLKEQKTEADKQLAEAQEALKAAQVAREKAQNYYEQQASAEAPEAASALAAAQTAVNTTYTTNTGESSKVEVPSSDKPSSVDWSAGKDAFVAAWAPRIESFLAGSPLAGHGSTFASAAWDYGVDPRWSPAIAAVESSRGLYCFKPCNAWGWGSSSWGDWDSAIRAHIAGLAAGYGSSISVTAAKKYCPPNWQYWYSSCLAYMETI